MYAVLETGGKQYRVTEGQLLQVETLEAQAGDTVHFDRVLAVGDGEQSKFGTPLLTGAKVTAEVIQHGRHKKIQILKFRRRKHHMKRQGHRQNFTKVKIVRIEA